MADYDQATVATPIGGIVTGIKLAFKGTTKGRDRDYLTNPRTGIQTLAGNALTAIYNQYRAGPWESSPQWIRAAIDAFEQVRAAFEEQVRDTNAIYPFFLQHGGSAAIDTINTWARQLIADRQGELAQLTGGNGGNSGTAASGGF